jgi:hypothetical protein
MRVAFDRLTDIHKLLLFALVDADEAPITEQSSRLSSLVHSLDPSNDDYDLEQVLLELSEGFIRLETIRDDYSKKEYLRVSWIHPSCRDLAIEQLSRRQKLRTRFLENCSIAGLELAMSVGGGATGARKLPLLRDVDDLHIFERRCRSLLPKHARLLSTLAITLKLVADTRSSSTNVTGLRKTARRLLDAFAKDTTAWHTSDLTIYYSLRSVLRVAGIPPSIALFFERESQEFHSLVTDDDRPITEFSYALHRFAQACQLIATEQPTDAIIIFGTDSYQGFLTGLARRGEEESEIDYIGTGWDSHDLKSESDAYLELGQAFSLFGALPTANEQRSLALRHQGAAFESEAEHLAEEAARRDPYADWQDTSEPDDTQDSTSNTELLRIFEDL